MRKKLVSLAVSAAMLVTSLSVPVFANGDSGAAELSSDTGAVIAFEGAEGGGEDRGLSRHQSGRQRSGHVQRRGVQRKSNSSVRRLRIYRLRY